MASLDTLSLLVLLTTVNSQQPIVSPNTISAGGTFTAYCDASRVTTPTPSSNDVITLRVSRMTPGSTAYTDIAQYSGNIIPSNQTHQNIPSDRKWNITFSGLGGAQNNKNTMKLVWDVYDARCEDAGTYQCTVTYIISFNQVPYSNTQNVTAISGISYFSLTVSPYLPGLEYDEGNITFTCQFYVETSRMQPAAVVSYEEMDGPENVRPQWELWTADFNGKYALNRVITEAVTADPVPGSGSGGCSQFIIVSTLKVHLTSNDDQNMYRCVAKTSNLEESSNITIGVVGRQPPLLKPIVVPVTFTINCDESRVMFPIQDQNVSDIFGLQLDVMLIGDNTFRNLAQYLSYGPPGSLEYKNPPKGRDWITSFEGSNQGINNRKSMKIQVLVKDARNTDTGTFRCKVLYFTRAGGLWLSEISYEHQVFL